MVSAFQLNGVRLRETCKNAYDLQKKRLVRCKSYRKMYWLMNIHETSFAVSYKPTVFSFDRGKVSVDNDNIY